MKARNVLRSLLLGFVLVSVGFCLGREITLRSRRATPQRPGAPAEGAPDKLIIYYMHPTFRCATCNRIEKMTREVLDQDFAAELADGRKSLLAPSSLLSSAQESQFVDERPQDQVAPLGAPVRPAAAADLRVPLPPLAESEEPAIDEMMLVLTPTEARTNGAGIPTPNIEEDLVAVLPLPNLPNPPEG